MIRSMVDGLERKLAADGADLDGWLRLIRARGVLGEADKARQSYDTARTRASRTTRRRWRGSTAWRKR